MKKILSCLLAAIIAVGSFTACSDSKTKESDKLSVVCTIFPEYDWVKEIIGNNSSNTELTLLLDNGVDLHSYQPSADDIIKVSDCDVFVYVGGESDTWVEDALKEAKNKDMVVINLLEVLGSSIKEEEVKEGMEGDHEAEDHDHEEEEIEYDEHVWLSLKNAVTICNYITDKLCSVDAENATLYKENSSAYIKELNALDAQYQEAASSSTQTTLLFGDRFPFRYLVDDYGLDYYAAFVGCSAETEASFETIAFLSKKVDELGLSAVMAIEGTTHKIAETIVENTANKNQKVLTLDSMQATTSKDAENGVTFLSIMTENLEVLKESLK